MSSFFIDCEKKWLRGLMKYGPEFVGNVRDEIYEEFVDARNYADEWRRQGLSLWRYLALRCVIRLGAWLCG